jgi:hypothetical protein
MRFALDLLTEAAQHPECDELFARVPWPSPEERRAMIAKRRADRAAWGDCSGEEDA